MDYSSSFAPGSKPVEKAVGIKFLAEMKGGYRKIFKICCSQTQDSSFIKKASFTSLWLESLKNCTESSMHCLAVNNILTFNEDQLAFKKSFLTLLTDETEISFSILASL